MLSSKKKKNEKLKTQKKCTPNIDCMAFIWTMIKDFMKPLYILHLDDEPAFFLLRRQPNKIDE